MLTKLAAVTLLPVLLMGGVVANSSIMLVQVSDGAEGFNLTVPVPLALAQIATAFAPAEFKRIELPYEAMHFLPQVDRFIDELEAMPDVLMVEVQDGADHVKVYKSEGTIKVEVRDAHGARVDVKVPLSMARGVLAAIDTDTGMVHASRLVSALRAAPSGDFVNVVDGDDRVRVRMW